MGRTFGVTVAAGTRLEEVEAQSAIQPGALGVTAWTGVTQKGPVGKAFRVARKSDFLFRAGNIIIDSLIPDAALLGFYRTNLGKGELWMNRVTAGNEKKSLLQLTNRRGIRSFTMQADAGNGGRWGGKKRVDIDEYDAVTQTTVQMTNVPTDLKNDELVDGFVSFSAVPSKSYKIITNDDTGLLTFASDTTLVTDLDGSADELIKVELDNNGLSIGMLIKDGTNNPTTEWGIEIYFIEGGIVSLAKEFDNLSSDPDASNYFKKVINDDSNSDFTITVEDLYSGSITADIRPANYFGKSFTLTDTVLTAKVHDDVPSSVLFALGEAQSVSLGASVIEDTVLLTVTTAGARATEVLTFPGNPVDADAIVINGKTITFKPVVADATAEVLIGVDAEATLDNLVTFINGSTDALLKELFFAKKATATTMNLFAQTAGTAGNAFTTTSSGGGGEPTWGGATLSGGIDQIWSYASTNMPFLTGLTVISGVAFTTPNVYGFGFTLIDTSLDPTKTWAIADTLTLIMRPFALNALEGGFVFPKESLFREKFQIISNTANTLTVKPGSAMTSNAASGDDFRLQYVQEMSGGYNGLADLTDSDYEVAYDTDNSPLRALRGQNLGLIKLASPGVTAAAVQKAGAAFGLANNWTFRYEAPSNILSEDAADEYFSETLGKNDLAFPAFPSFGKISNPAGKGLKLIPLTGHIHGVEAKFANDNTGFHKPAAGEDAILTGILELVDGLPDRPLDEEFLNPRGIAVIKQISGNFVIWGNKTFGTDPGFTFKHHRETLSHYENVFLENFDFIIFALNNPNLKETLLSSFSDFFRPEFARSAITGRNLSDAVRIKIDDENNTSSTEEAGDLFAEIAPRIVGAVERFVMKISRLGITEEV